MEFFDQEVFILLSDSYLSLTLSPKLPGRTVYSARASRNLITLRGFFFILLATTYEVDTFIGFIL